MDFAIANIQHSVTNNISDGTFSYHNLWSLKVVFSDGKLTITNKLISYSVSVKSILYQPWLLSCWLVI